MDSGVTPSVGGRRKRYRIVRRFHGVLSQRALVARLIAAHRR